MYMWLILFFFNLSAFLSMTRRRVCDDEIMSILNVNNESLLSVFGHPWVLINNVK
jgi:hypothetical protein